MTSPTPGWLVAWAGDEQSAVLEVAAAGEAASAVGAHVAALVDVQAASRLAARDVSLWGAPNRTAVAGRLGWVDLPESSWPTAERLDELRADLAAEGRSRLVVHDVGGATRPPLAAGHLLTADQLVTEQQLGPVVADGRSVIVLLAGSVAGRRLERLASLLDAALGRLVVVADAGGEAAAWGSCARALFLTDPGLGGPFAALDAAALVPAALAGVDVSDLLDEAAIVADLMAEDAEANPALVLAAAMAGTTPLRQTVQLVDRGGGHPGLLAWVADLVAATTGLTPVVAATEADQSSAMATTAESDMAAPDDVLVVSFTSATDDVVDDEVAPLGGGASASVGVTGPLGAQILLWQYAAAIAARLSGRSPFGSPSPAEPARVMPNVSAAGRGPVARNDPAAGPDRTLSTGTEDA